MTADAEAVEAVSEILSSVCPGGVSIEQGFELVDEGLRARADRSLPVTVRGYVPALDGGAADQAVARARTMLGHLQAFGLRPIGELDVQPVHEADWAEAWKRHFPVLRVGRRLVIRPTWRRHRAAPRDVVLALDPGMAFGTGLHPTTRLCLAMIEDWADEGRLRDARVLDLGCGSGILAVAAARLGARVVLGLDTDPLAAEATRANARRNRVARRVTARRGSLPVSEAPFDLVAANLIASVLVDLAALLAAALRTGGRLLASGIVHDREDEVRAALESERILVVRREVQTDWVALEAERNA